MKQQGRREEGGGKRRESNPLQVWLWGALLATASGCASAHKMPIDSPNLSDRDALRVTIDSLVSTPQFRTAHWGILIVDPVTGDTVYSRNAGKLFMPASNMKIVTGAVALAQLGPDFRFRTTVAVRRETGTDTLLGPGGVLRGDLLIFGRGDPSASDNMLGNAMLPLRGIADSLASRGVLRITGRLLSAGDAFSDANHGMGWGWDDFDYPYSAGVDELLFNEAFSRVIVRAGVQPGETPTVETAPSRSYPPVHIRAGTVALDAAAANDSSARRRLRDLVLAFDSVTGGYTVKGNIAVGDSAVLTVAHRDPARAYISALREALGERGIVVGGASRDTSGVADTLFTMWSPPLREILPALEKPSQNQIGEVLLKTLGLERTSVGSADSGRAVIERQLAEWRVEPDGYAVRDGSGLSRHNYLTPETVVRVLDVMRRHAAFSAFYEALPIAGVDGTIATRMRGTAAAGNLRAKTGTIDRARSLSGYVTTADGRMLIFSLLCNNHTSVTAVTRVQDAIGARLAELRLSGSTR